MAVRLTDEMVEAFKAKMRRRAGINFNSELLRVSLEEVLRAQDQRGAVRWCMSPDDPGECEDYTSDAAVAEKWRKRGLSVIPLYASPDVATLPADVKALVERLRADAAQLRKMVEQAQFGGDETGVRVKSPELLLADLDDAAATLLSATGETRAAHKNFIDAWEALPVGHHGFSTVEEWLIQTMKPAVDRARAFLPSTKDAGDAR
jgi:hypothetical protein